MRRGASDSPIDISPSVIGAGDFESRVAAARAIVDRAWRRTAEAGNTDTAEQGRLRALAADVGARVVGVHHTGLRGRLIRPVKAAIRRLIYWYVEPSWIAQRRLNDELITELHASRARLDQLTSEFEQLAVRYEQAQNANARLERCFAAHRRARTCHHD